MLGLPDTSSPVGLTIELELPVLRRDLLGLKTDPRAGKTEIRK